MFKTLPLCLTVFIFLAVQTYADDSPAQPQEPEIREVFLPDDDATVRRDQQLESIKSVTESGNRPPNIVLFLADDLGYGDLGITGSKSIPTPRIDSIGKQGARFSDAYVTAASCSPSRAGLMSGRYQQRFGFEFNTSGAAITHRYYRGLDPAVVTITDVLSEAGYRTGMFGKWHLGTRAHLHPMSRGFDEFYGFLSGAHSFFAAQQREPISSTIMRYRTPLIEPEYLTDAIARETVKFIDKHHEVPFFAYVPFNAVHTPIEATEKYQQRFPDEQNPKQRDYNAMTSALDDAVGSVLDTLAKHDLDENTLVIFLNDNGGPTYTGVQSNGELKLGKLYLFEGGIRVPLLMRFKGVIEPDSEFRSPVSSLDMFPTICAAAGIELPKDLQLDGVDLLPHLQRDVAAVPHEKLFWSNGPNRAMRMGNWKLVQSYEHIWLYDLATDIGEQNNLRSKRPEIVEAMLREIDEWRKEMPPTAWPSKERRQKVKVDGGLYELNI